MDTNLRDFYLADYSKIITYGNTNADSIMRMYAKQLAIDKTFYKADFNNDGYTDLLLIGGWNDNRKTPCDRYQLNSQIVMNGGKGKSTTYSLALDYNYPFVPQIVYRDKLPLLVLHHPQKLDTVYPPRPDILQVKLICKSGQFVEFNSKPIKSHTIKKIQFATADWESAPSFQLALEKNADSWFIAISHNFTKDGYNEGAFKTMINESDFDGISELLNYIEFENLRRDYGIYNTGPPSNALIITYDDGKVKEIYNYAGAGTYGLQAIYNKLYELRFSQNWQRAEEPDYIRISPPQKRNSWRIAN